MKKNFIIFLICAFYCSSAAFVNVVAEQSHSNHNHHGEQNNCAHCNQGCSGNCSNPKVLTYVKNFNETLTFADCKEHSLVKYTQILHYSDGSTTSNYHYRILGSNGGIIADNLYHAQHFINSKGKHYFLVKSPDYAKRDYIIMDSKGKVSQTHCYSKYKILGTDNLIVQQNRKYGIVDFDNNVVLDIKYKSIEELDNVLLTKYNGYYGLKDKNGSTILENKYDKISRCGNLFVLKYQDKYGIANLSGKILYNPQFDNIKQDGDYIKVKSENRYGIININGELIAPVKYKKVRVERNIPQVYENSNWIYSQRSYSF